MSVLPHEGTHPILYGTASIPAGTRVHTAYLARPDLGGAHSGLVLAPGGDGITPGVKDLCRRLARHGLAVIAVDAAAATRVRALGDIAAFLRAPGVEWCDGGRIVVGGIGVGSPQAVSAAMAAAARGVALLDLDPGTGLTPFPGPGLALLAGADWPDDAVASLRRLLPGVEVARYGSAARGFLDVADGAFDAGAAADAVTRLAAFVVAAPVGAGG